jgi:hypothetical protein
MKVTKTQEINVSVLECGKRQPCALASTEPVCLEFLLRIICALVISRVCAFCFIIEVGGRKLGKLDIRRS